MSMVTYKIASDLNGRLKEAARTACNFWNRFLTPGQPIVLRLGIFHSAGPTIARAYYPFTHEGTKYGRIEYNTKYLTTFTADESASTVIHEIGHTLGMGFDGWLDMFDHGTGQFYPKSTQRLPSLREMLVELDGGPGTELSHWDEDQYGKELMTGYKNDGSEYVLPVTIDVMGLMGHVVDESLDEQQLLEPLMRDQPIFSLYDQARSIDRDYFEETRIREEFYGK